MHNKFLIFAKEEVWQDEEWEFLGGEGEPSSVTIPKPYGVWTGSFNLTKNATYSLDNAIYLTEKVVVDAYYREFGQIAAMSENR